MFKGVKDCSICKNLLFKDIQFYYSLQLNYNDIYETNLLRINSNDNNLSFNNYYTPIVDGYSNILFAALRHPICFDNHTNINLALELLSHRNL